MFSNYFQFFYDLLTPDRAAPAPSCGKFCIALPNIAITENLSDMKRPSLSSIRLHLLAVSLLCGAFPSWAWKPVFAGHRGSYTGVQNTAEAFSNGVDKYGYTGLECDVRVTSDGYYVISHDETTTSLGGSLTVAGATLAELQAETLTQTRGGVTYTGTICTVEEYLDICVEKGAFPILELKWATGINSNDMSNFPGLASLVKSKGLEQEAIFLTSMKASIEYIRTNYPEFTCQFLTGEYWSSNYDWCVTWGVNPSIQAGYFDIYTVKQFRDAGLEVAVWTVNTLANYQKYGDMGVYMMTCDYLYPSEMPDLDDIDWDNLPEQVDPIEIELATMFRYSEIDGTLPDNFPVSDSSKSTYTTGQQAAWYDGVFYVNDYGTGTLLTYDSSGQVENSLSGTSSHGIAVDDAGNLILRDDGITSSPSKLRVYRQGSSEAVDLSFSLLNPGQTNFITASGDIFSDEGGYVYFFPNGQTVVNMVRIASGEVAGVSASGELSLTGSTAGYVIPVDNDTANFIYQVRAYGYYRYSGKDTGGYVAGTGSTTAPNRNNSIGGAIFTLDGHELFVHCSGTNYNGGFTIRDMTADGEALISVDPLGSIGYTSGNVSCGAFFAVERVDESTVNLYEYCMAGGYAGYTITVAESGVAAAAADEAAALGVYPNPCSGAATLRLGEPIRDIVVTDIAGKRALRLSGDGGESQQVDLSPLAAGFYVISVNGSAAARVIKR